MLVTSIAIACGFLTGLGYSAVALSDGDKPASARTVKALLGYALSSLLFPAVAAAFLVTGTQSDRLLGIFMAIMESFSVMGIVFLVVLAFHRFRKKPVN